jgi:hypothetical protein
MMISPGLAVVSVQELASGHGVTTEYVGKRGATLPVKSLIVVKMTFLWPEQKKKPTATRYPAIPVAVLVFLCFLVVLHCQVDASTWKGTPSNNQCVSQKMKIQNLIVGVSARMTRPPSHWREAQAC